MKPLNSTRQGPSTSLRRRILYRFSALNISGRLASVLVGKSTLEDIRRPHVVSSYDSANVDVLTYNGLRITERYISIRGYVIEDGGITSDCEVKKKYYYLHRSKVGPNDSGYFVKEWNVCERVQLKPEMFINELIKCVRPWSTLKHGNIAPFIGVIGPDFCGFLGIITPDYINGNIVSYMKEHPDSDVQPFLRDIADALTYVHSKGLVHGELKGSNIVIDNDHKVRLTDFGQLNLFEELQFAGERGCGTYRLRVRDNFLFVAPELLKTFLFIGSRKTIGHYTPESDIYAFAMTMYQIYTLKHPYADETDKQVLAHDIWYKNRRPHRPSEGEAPQLGNDMWELITDCWATLPNSRPKLDEIKRRIVVAPQVTTNPPSS